MAVKYKIAETRRFILDNQHLTRQQQADALGKPLTSLCDFVCRNELWKGRQGMRKPLRCSEPLLSIFRELDRMNITSKRVAQELHVSPPAIVSWRSGRQEPRLAYLQCLATLAKMRLVAEKTT